MTKMRFRIPFVGFVFTFVGFIASIVALSKYFDLYSVAGYPTNWWTVMFSALSILVLTVILVNSILFADDPFFMIAFYVGAAFMLIYGALAMLQPCISEIAFVLGSPDLAMGDNAIRVFISDNAISTTVWYAVASVCTIVGAFTPNMFKRKDERRCDRIKKDVKSLYKYNKKANKTLAELNIDVQVDPIPQYPTTKGMSIGEETAEYTNYMCSLYSRLKNLKDIILENAEQSSVGNSTISGICKTVKKYEDVMRYAQSCDNASDDGQACDNAAEQPVCEEVNNG